MDDDKIIKKGGGEIEINQFAEANGADDVKRNQRVIVPLSMVDINDMQEGEELEFTFLVAPKEGDTEEDKVFIDLIMRRETEEDLKNINL